MTTPEQATEIAKFMLAEYLQAERLEQRRATWIIRGRFGEQNLYKNKNGHWAIDQIILDEFQKIRPADVVWSRSRQLWRKRRDGDLPNSIMVR